MKDDLISQKAVNDVRVSDQGHEARWVRLECNGHWCDDEAVKERRRSYQSVHSRIVVEEADGSLGRYSLHKDNQDSQSKSKNTMPEHDNGVMDGPKCAIKHAIAGIDPRLEEYERVAQGELLLAERLCACLFYLLFTLSTCGPAQCNRDHTCKTNDHAEDLNWEDWLPKHAVCKNGGPKRATREYD